MLIKCLGQGVDSEFYPKAALEYLLDFQEMISHEEMCRQLDQHWDETLKKHRGQKEDAFYADFYSHPVWALNSVFSETDPASVMNRRALIRSIVELRIGTVADMGGGYGAFLRMIKTCHATAGIDCFLSEPYIDREVAEALQGLGITTSETIPAGKDAYIFLDVLEHLEHPLEYLDSVIRAAKPTSYFFFGNCFYPVIKCHLESTFYLRESFVAAARMMGLERLGCVQKAPYIEVWKGTAIESSRGKLLDMHLRSVLEESCQHGGW